MPTETENVRLRRKIGSEVQKAKADVTEDGSDFCCFQGQNGLSERDQVLTQQSATADILKVISSTFDLKSR